MSPSLSPVRAADLDAVLLFMSRLYGQDAIPFDADRSRRTAEWLLGHPDSGGIWMIEAGGQPAGYMVLTVCVSLEFRGPFALLDELFVDEAFRGRGLGSHALNFAAEWARARGMSAVRLETAHDNFGAQALYRRHGFLLHDRHLMTRWL